MHVNRERWLVLGALGLLAVGIFVAVASALDTPTASSGVAAAHATVLHGQTRSVNVGGETVVVSVNPSGSVCYRAPHASACVARLADDEVSYATGRVHSQTVIAGVAGKQVHAVIARLTHKGTIWPAFRDGAFYAVLPRGRALRAIVKVLAGGRRVAIPATA